jgi:ADP-ribose pyrophosphatase YjhB (NUDIX family)
MLNNLYQDDFGAGALIIAKNTGRVLLGLRSNTENNPNVWATPGGHVDSGERIEDGLIREIKEETGYNGPISFIQFPLGKKALNGFKFYNFIGIVQNEFKAKGIGEYAKEHKKWGWFDFENLPEPLHPKMMKDINKVKHFVKTIKNMFLWNILKIY